MIIKQMIEFSEHLFIDFATCDKLAFVEAGTIIQQKFNVFWNDFFAVSVNAALKLLPNPLPEFQNNLFLA